MRIRLMSVAALATLALFAQAEDGAARSPFAGWDAKRIASHRRKARSQITSKVKQWLAARPELVYQCKTCRGRGAIVRTFGSGRREGKVKDPCALCCGTGARISTSRFYILFWEQYRPEFRRTSARKKKLEQDLLTAERDPANSPPRFAGITSTKRGDLRVEGNFAILSFRDRLGRKTEKQEVEWIEAEGGWWLAHAQADSGFVRWGYLDDDPVRGEEEPEPDVVDPEREPTGLIPIPEPVPAPNPKPKPEPLDPELYIQVGAPVVKHTEENAYKVFGRLTNKSPTKRLTYITVQVSLFRGQELVDTVTCNVGTSILDPGMSATYHGYIYSDEPPEYDRIEAKVAQFDMLE